MRRRTPLRRPGLAVRIREIGKGDRALRGRAVVEGHAEGRALLPRIEAGGGGARVPRGGRGFCDRGAGRAIRAAAAARAMGFMMISLPITRSAAQGRDHRLAMTSSQTGFTR